MAYPQVGAIEAGRGELQWIADQLVADAERSFGTARSLIARSWSGLAAIEAIATLDDQRRLVTVAGEAIGAAAAALAPLISALHDAAAAQASADRAAIALGLDLETASDGTVATVRVRPDASDPGLAVDGIGAIRDVLAESCARVEAADCACASRLRELVDVARSMVVFPVRPAAGSGVDHFDVPVAAEPGLLAAAPLLHSLAASPPVAAVPLTGAAQAVRDPSVAAADLAAPTRIRELAGRLALFGAAAGPATVTARIAAGLLVPAADGAPRRVLEWDPKHGHAAEVAGDLESADRVVIFVPGPGASLSHCAPIAAAVTEIYDAVRADSADERVAVIGWLGAALPPNLAAAALQSYAKNAAPSLAAFVRGLRLSPQTRVTLVGHSYGGTVAGLAVHQGLRPNALVGLGAPGFGPQVDSTRDLGAVPTFVLTHPGDPINEVQPVQRELEGLLGAPLGPLGAYVADRFSGAAGLGHLGADPTRLPGAVRLSTGDDGAHRPIIATDLALHSEYLEDGSMSLAQVARIADSEAPVKYAP